MRGKCYAIGIWFNRLANAGLFYEGKSMTSRDKFEAWMTAEQWFHGSDFEWDERRNCYSQFGIHLAYKAWQAASKASEQQLAAMVAENASIKTMNDCLSEELRSYESDGAFDGPEMHHLWWGCETPATDAILNEVRADGVAMYADHLDSAADDAERDGFDDAVKFLRSEASSVRLFAAQLRQGEKL